MLALWHALIIRLHNFVAVELTKQNPGWTSDKLFEESRRLALAIYNHFVYNEWLVLILGKNREA